jgi:hypothetical protein
LVLGDLRLKRSFRQPGVAGAGQETPFPGQDKKNLSSSVGRLHGNGNLGERRAVDQKIEGQGGPEQGRQVAIDPASKEAHVGPRGVDHSGRSKTMCAVSAPIARLDARTRAVLDQDALDLHVVERPRSAAARPAQKIHENSFGAQHDGIVPERPATQAPAPDLREQLHRFARAQDAARGQARPRFKAPIAVKSK